MMRDGRRSLFRLSAAALAVFAAAAAHAELVLSELIVELRPGQQMREDIEVWNDSPERSFVSIEPREILDASLPSQRVHTDPDPEKLGLLVSPARMILEPGQRKLVRIASLAPAGDRERVYRVTVKPVVGNLQPANSGLKIVLGYDVLVLVRPARPVVDVSGSRNGKALRFVNSGNESVEVIDGRQCPASHAPCAELPGKRLYPGASWTVELPSDLPAEYTLKSPERSVRKSY
jgi:P pilus assembly chaperone PapD